MVETSGSDRILHASDVHRSLPEAWSDLQKIFSSYSRIPELYVPAIDDFPDKIPIPNRSLFWFLKNRKANASSLGLEIRRNKAGEMVLNPDFSVDSYRVELEGIKPTVKKRRVGHSFVNMVTPEEFHEPHTFNNKKIRAIQEEDVRKMKEYYKISAAITGGADNGLETAGALQALTIYQRYKKSRVLGWDWKVYQWDLNRRLKKRYGLKVSPKSLDEMFGILDTYYKDKSPQSTEIAREIMRQKPALYFTYLVRSYVDFSERLSINKGQAIVDELEGFFLRAQEINIGKTTESNNYVYANINDVISLHKELWAAQYSHAYALGHEIVARKTQLPYWARQSSTFSTYLHTNLAVSLGLVTRDALEDGRVILRGNFKSPSSLITEALLRNPSFQDEIYRIAKTMGIDIPAFDAGPYSSKVVSRSRHGFKILNQILMRAGQVDGDPWRNDVLKLTDDLVKSMENLEYFIRSNIYVDRPEELDSTVSRAEAIVSSFPADVKKINPDAITTKALGAIDKQDSYWFNLMTLEEIKSRYKDNPRFPSYFMFDFLRRVVREGVTFSGSDASPFFMYYLHVPGKIIVDDKEPPRVQVLSPEELRVMKPQDVLWMEMEVNLKEFEALNSIHRLLWELRMHGIPWRHAIPKNLNATKVNEALLSCAKKDDRSPGDWVDLSFPWKTTDNALENNVGIIN